MNNLANSRRGAGLLEVLLVLVVIALVLQLFPSLAYTILWAVDVRNWSRSVWFLVNLAAVMALFSIKLAPDIKRAAGSIHKRWVAIRKNNLQPDHDERYRQAKDWAERAKKRLPFQ